jgi:lauroyl/myristoyl acyltransferase
LELGWVSALERQAKRAYTGAMRTAKKIRYRLEWLGLKFATKFVPLLSRKACYRLARLLGSLAAILDRRGPTRCAE